MKRWCESCDRGIVPKSLKLSPMDAYLVLPVEGINPSWFITCSIMSIFFPVNCEGLYILYCLKVVNHMVGLLNTLEEFHVPFKQACLPLFAL